MLLSSTFRPTFCRAAAPSRTLVVLAVEKKPTVSRSAKPPTVSKSAPPPAPAAKPKAAPAPAPAPAAAKPKAAPAAAKAAPKKAAAPKAPAAEKPKKAAKPATLRAPSAFNLYVKDNYAAFAKEHPGKKATEVMPLLNAKWKTLSAAARQPYETTAAKLKADVDTKRAALKAEKKKHARPMNAYMAAYVAALPQLKAKYPDKKMLEIAKIFKTQWDALPAKEKEEKQAAYKAALEKWKKEHPKA